MYLGIDVGTSSVKVIVMDKQGVIIESASEKYPLSFPKPLWSEQNPEDWWQGTADAIKKICTKNPGLGEQIEGISFSGQMHGLVILDEAGEVLRPSILWNDGRTQKQCDYLNDIIGRDKLSAYTGNIALSGFTGPKVMWVKENEPEIFDKIAHILLPKDYIRFRLTGEYKIDAADAAGTLFFDVKNKAWSKEMVDILSIKPEWLPEVYNCYEVTGIVQKDVADELGISDKAKVIGGGGDQAVGAVGTGTVASGVVSVALGTSGVVFASVDDYKVDKENRMHSFNHANGKFTQMGVMLSAAYSLQWWVEEVNKDIQAENPYKVLRDEAAKVPAGSEGLIFLPYLSGERTPHADVNATGVFIGLKPSHTRGHMTRAVMEGVGYGLRDSLEILKDMQIPIHEMRITGGGVRNELWVEILASIFNYELNIVEASEGPAYGASVLAAVGCGLFNSVEEACRELIKVSKIIKPCEEDAKVYDKYYQVFKKGYGQLKDIYKDLAEL
ncbi:xylulokinase [Cellulosilyticum sp. I15G10I2]|uniref:xylulokinase n=1 Tax=Cellulosilyticum sp. I15G10I2 TaxID=1892843 RepID=UPI00085BC1BD|nr:xylulokinase [Cellulosilyticum sp. I15G10I2]